MRDKLAWLMPIGMKILPRRIREIRKRLGMTQSDFATAVGVSQATASRWERSDLPQSPDFEAIYQITKLANISLEELLGDDHNFRAKHAGTKAVVVGGAKANHWVESPYWDESQHFEVVLPTPIGWPQLDIHGFLVQDDSFDEEFPRGSIVFCDMSTPPSVDHNERVILSRWREDGLCDITVRATMIDQRGKLGFVSLTNKFELASRVSHGDPGIDKLIVLGPVIAAFKLQKPFDLD